MLRWDLLVVCSFFLVALSLLFWLFLSLPIVKVIATSPRRGGKHKVVDGKGRRCGLEGQQYRLNSRALKHPLPLFPCTNMHRSCTEHEFGATRLISAFITAPAGLTNMCGGGSSLSERMAKASGKAAGIRFEREVCQQVRYVSVCMTCWGVRLEGWRVQLAIPNLPVVKVRVGTRVETVPGHQCSGHYGKAGHQDNPNKRRAIEGLL